MAASARSYRPGMRQFVSRQRILFPLPSSYLFSILYINLICIIEVNKGIFMRKILSLVSLGLCVSLLAATVQAKGHLTAPVSDNDYYPTASAAKLELGKALFFDKIISGNQNISCATCHHPLAWTGDGLALPVGEGGIGLGPTRDTGSGADAIHERVPRNAPHIFNLGAKEFSIMFHDGRVFPDSEHPSGYYSPAEDQLPIGLDNSLAVQAMFPVTSGAEMAGQSGENEIADAAAVNQLGGHDGVWELLAQRLRNIPEYVNMFQDAFPQQIFQAEDIHFKDAANAIATFEASAWRADNSRFDQHLRGNKLALSPQEKWGMRLFYGKAGCAQCHSGKFQSDQSFHAIAMPQIGPGKGDNSDGYVDGREDFGHEAVTGDIEDRFKFRTPTLRNVVLTAPYGHSGAYNTLESVVRHHLSPIRSLYNYDSEQIVMPSNPYLDSQDLIVMNDPVRVSLIAQSNELRGTLINDKQFAALMSFLYALTDNSSLDMRDTIPGSVPSGLPLAE